jgi:competence protein ComFC
MLKTEHYKRSIPSFSLEKVVVGAFYDEEMQKKIHRFKFVHNHVDRVYFQRLFLQIQEEYPYIPDIIVYPPVSLRDRIFRGPNHAKKLVEYFASNIPTLSPFYKSFFTSHQSRRTKQERIVVREEYSFLHKYSNMIQGKKILLIDDLITTGYTAHTLGKLLKKAGAIEVVWYFLASEKIG